MLLGGQVRGSAPGFKAGSTFSFAVAYFFAGFRVYTWTCENKGALDIGTDVMQMHGPNSQHLVSILEIILIDGI